MKLSIVVPLYNEERYIEELLRRVASAPLPPQITGLEILVVDDFSVDRSAQIVNSIIANPQSILLKSNASLRLISQDKNGGKGKAVRRGFSEASGNVILVQDADLEYDPQDYPALLKPITENYADVVFGSRFIGTERRVLYFWHYMANTFLTFLSNLFTNLNLTDMETCYKVFRADILKRISLESDRFGFEPEVTAKVAKLKCRIFEVGIRYHGRTYEEGKKITWKDGLAALWFIIKYNLFN